jgi:hypothetical protein
MNCFMCAADGRAATAVGVCPDCGAGLCLGHRQGERAQPGGTSIGCSHQQIDISIVRDEQRGAIR